MRPGGGGRFAAGKAAMERKGMPASEAGAIMAKAGMKKFGKAKMQKWAKAGKKRKS